MSLPTSQPLPPDDEREFSRARRRRKQRMIVPDLQSEQTAFVEELARQSVPSFDFLLFSLLAGFALIVAAFMDAPAFFVMVALAAPFMSPVVGLSLAAIVGSLRFFGQALGAMGIGSLLVFLCGLLAGLLGRIIPGAHFLQASTHTYFSWADLLVLSIGAGLTTFLLARNPQQKPVLTSVALAYELYLPLGVAGIGLSSGAPGLWPNGLIVFLVNLAWAIVIGTVVLAIMGMRPLTKFGYALGSSLLIIGLAALVALSGMGTIARYQRPTPSLTPSPIPSITPTHYSTSTPPPPTRPPTRTETPIPSATFTASPLPPTPTPLWAVVNANEGSGAWMRAEPSLKSNSVQVLVNGTLVEVFESIISDNREWVHVRVAKSGEEGWMMRSLIATATPRPRQ